MDRKGWREALAPVEAVVWNILQLFVVYALARGIYLIENWSYFSQGMTWDRAAEMMRGGLVFDTAAILVTNIPYIVLSLLPVRWLIKRSYVSRAGGAYQQLCRWVYLIINGLALAVNMCDAVYFKYTMRRTTTTVFSEFQNEGNLGGIFLTETLQHFYLVIAFAVIMWVLYRGYRQGWHQKSGVKSQETGAGSQEEGRRYLKYDLVALVSLIVMAPFVVAGIRGGFTTAVRPITISNANQYVNRPIEAALVLNTPFSLYRTIGKNVFEVPAYYSDAKEMEAVYSPIHNIASPARDARQSSTARDSSFTRKNVVVLIVESFGREYIGALNRSLEGGRYKGYTPCVDSLIAKSTTFTRTFCNGKKSIDGMPSILSSIPMFVEPFFLTPASMNHVSGIASLLAGEGYQTAFFHGAQRGSMGFMAFARSTGFQDYYGREDYDNDKRFGGDDDFDGMWAIWDEPFLQYYATKMSEMKEPFMTAVFTASSHHPYVIPEKYKDTYPEEDDDEHQSTPNPIHKCIRYTDMAIGKFFESVSREPWFKNTIFVLTSDHTNLSDHAYYQTDLGGFCSPIIIYEPGQQPQMLDKIAQQIDILPTVMGMLGYDKPYCAFGIDVLNTPAEETWAVNYLNGTYQYVKHGQVLQYDGQQTKAVYALTDSLMQHNIKGKAPHQYEMERELKAIIQQYMTRMVEDRLHP